MGGPLLKEGKEELGDTPLVCPVCGASFNLGTKKAGDICGATGVLVCFKNEAHTQGIGDDSKKSAICSDCFSVMKDVGEVMPDCTGILIPALS